MSNRSHFHELFNAFKNLPVEGQSSRAKRRLRLGVESMEDRTMPSAVPVTAPDGGTWVKIDTISVSTLNNRNSATGISSSVTLQNGVSYLAVAHETGRIATDSTGFADAEFIRYNKDTGPQDGSSPGYTWVNHGVRLAGLDGGETTGNLWGGYQPDHQYVKNFIGRGAKVTGYYTDIPRYYGDNSGSITVDFYASLKPTVNLTSSAPVAVYGQPVTLTATVAANSTAFGSPTGAVTFFDGDTVLGVGTLTSGTANVTVKLNAGDHAIRAVYSGSGAWPSASASLSQIVDPATLLVTAYDQTIVPGEPLPNLTYTVEGFVNGDSPGLITGALATDATPDSDPGEYLIQQGTLSAGPNYAIDFYPGTLTVFQKPGAPVNSLKGQIALKGNSTSSAEKGKFTPKDGKERISSDAELESTRPHFMKYDGAT